jgi:hypothetical protein
MIAASHRIGGFLCFLTIIEPFTVDSSGIQGVLPGAWEVYYLRVNYELREPKKKGPTHESIRKKKMKVSEVRKFKYNNRKNYLKNVTVIRQLRNTSLICIREKGTTVFRVASISPISTLRAPKTNRKLVGLLYNHNSYYWTYNIVLMRWKAKSQLNYTMYTDRSTVVVEEGGDF